MITDCFKVQSTETMLKNRTTLLDEVRRKIKFLSSFSPESLSSQTHEDQVCESAGNIVSGFVRLCLGTVE